MTAADTDEILASIKSRLDAGRLVLPTLPDVAMEVRAAVTSGNSSAQELADIIASDAALAARLIQVVNSPLYRGRQEIDKLPMAIARLGNNTVKTLIMSLAMQQIFNSGSAELETELRNIWEQSVNVSAISRALASYSGSLDPEQAMLAGLIHQIGKLPVLMLASSKDSPLDATQVIEIMDRVHPAIGRIIMESWDFPESLRPVASEYLDFKRDGSGKPDYVDVVQIAYLQNSAEHNNQSQNADWREISAFARLGLEPEVEILEIEGVSEEVEQAHALLAS